MYLDTSKTTRHIVAVTRGHIFDGDAVLPLSLKGFQHLAISKIVAGRRIMGGITKNAQVHVAAALAASTQVEDSGSGSVPSCLF